MDKYESYDKARAEGSYTTLRFPPNAMENWPNSKDAELLILPTVSFTMNILPLAKVDEEDQDVEVFIG